MRGNFVGNVEGGGLKVGEVLTTKNGKRWVIVSGGHAVPEDELLVEQAMKRATEALKQVREQEKPRTMNRQERRAAKAQARRKLKK